MTNFKHCIAVITFVVEGSAHLVSLLQQLLLLTTSVTAIHLGGVAGHVLPLIMVFAGMKQPQSLHTFKIFPKCSQPLQMAMRRSASVITRSNSLYDI